MFRRPRSGARLVPILAGLLLAGPAGGVVIDTGDGSGNTSEPSDDPGFANVGAASNSLSGVYIGDRWVLTANHVGAPASFSFDETPYATVPGSRIRLETSPGVGADLALIRLEADPPLPPVVIASTGPAVDDAVVMIGNGRSREASLTCWNSSFNEVTCGMGPPPAYTGYVAAGTRFVRWGRNEVTVVGNDETIPGSGTSRVFETRFDVSGGVTDECQVANGDSGGGAFLKRGNEWQLVGILIAQNLVSGSQPINTAVFGSDTLILDVAFYADQIDAIVNPPFVIPAAPVVALVVAAGVMVAGVRRAHQREKA